MGKVHVEVHEKRVALSDDGRGVGSYVKEVMQEYGHHFVDVLKLGFGIHSFALDFAENSEWLSTHVGQIIGYVYPSSQFANTERVLRSSGFSSIAALVNPFTVPSFLMNSGAVDILGGAAGLHMSFCGPECHRRCKGSLPTFAGTPKMGL